MILIYDRSSVRRELPMNNLQQNHPVVDRFRALPNPSQLIFSELGRHKNDKTCGTDRNCSERNASGCLKWEGAILQATAEDPFQILPVSDSTHLCQAAPLLFSPKQLPYFPRRHQGQKNKSAGPQPANAPSHIHSWTTHFLYIHESSRNKKWFSGSLPSWITKIMIKKHDLHFEKKKHQFRPSISMANLVHCKCHQTFRAHRCAAAVCPYTRRCTSRAPPQLQSNPNSQRC